MKDTLDFLIEVGSYIYNCSILDDCEKEWSICFDREYKFTNVENLMSLNIYHKLDVTSQYQILMIGEYIPTTDEVNYISFDELLSYIKEEYSLKLTLTKVTRETNAFPYPYHIFKVEEDTCSS